MDSLFEWQISTAVIGCGFGVRVKFGVTTQMGSQIEALSIGAGLTKEVSEVEVRWVWASHAFLPIEERSIISTSLGTGDRGRHSSIVVLRRSGRTVKRNHMASVSRDFKSITSGTCQTLVCLQVIESRSLTPSTFQTIREGSLRRTLNRGIPLGKFVLNLLIVLLLGFSLSVSELAVGIGDVEDLGRYLIGALVVEFGNQVVEVEVEEFDLGLDLVVTQAVHLGFELGVKGRDFLLG